MIFRYARHTSNLKKIENFYTHIVGLEKLGKFKNHNEYDGIFLGFPLQQWHLEFTCSKEKPLRSFDEDDILVFYQNSEIEMLNIKQHLIKNNIKIETPKNPYWIENGLMISDPDGHKIIFAEKNISFESDDELTNLILKQEIGSWSELLNYIQHLPYGRNKNREDFSLVLKEQKGTCSSKHAFLKKIAELNNIENVKLIVGIYKMNEINTPKVAATLKENKIEYIPEAHCYLKLNNFKLDITTPNSNIDVLENDILTEIEIEAEQVTTFKVNYHKEYLKNWLQEQDLDFSLDELWAIREQCIKNLEA